MTTNGEGKYVEHGREISHRGNNGRKKDKEVRRDNNVDEITFNF